MPPDLQLAVNLPSHFCLTPSAFSSSLPSKGKRETFSHGIHHVLLSTNRKPHGQNSGSLEKFLASLSIYRALLPYKRECRHPLVAISSRMSSSLPSRFPFDLYLSPRHTSSPITESFPTAKTPGIPVCVCVRPSVFVSDCCQVQGGEDS